MRPTVIRLIVGGALGIAFSISLMLPGALVLPEEHSIGQVAAPGVPSTMVVRAAPVAAPKRVSAPARRRVVVQRVSASKINTAPAESAVRHAPSRSRPAGKPVTRTSPTAQALTMMAAPPAAEAKDEPSEPESAKQPKKIESANQPKKVESAKKPKNANAAKPKKAKPAKPKKVKKRGEEKEKSGDRGKKDEDRADHERGGGGRQGDDSLD